MANLLAIETSSDALSVAILNGIKVYSFHEIKPKQHTEDLLGIIEDLLSAAHIKLSSLDAIGVSCGPGSFTGIRLACSVAQGLAYGLNIPGIKISSLEVLSEGIFKKFKPKQIVVLLDAHREKLFMGIFSYSEEGLISSKIKTIDQVEFDSNYYNSETYFITNASKVLVSKIKEVSMNIYNDYPHSLDLLNLVSKKFEIGDFLSSEELLPNYLVEQENWETY